MPSFITVDVAQS